MNLFLSLSILIAFKCWSVRCDGFGPMPNAFIYNGPVRLGHAVAEYAKAPETWKNMTMLLTPVVRKSRICVTGTFLIYSESQSTRKSEVSILNGLNACTSLSSFGRVTSIELASSYNGIFYPSLVIFKEAFFGGKFYPVSQEILNRDMSFPWKVNSLVMNGKQSWTVRTKKGVNYCLRPGPTFQSNLKFPICLVTDKEFKFQDENWASIHKDCAQDIKKENILLLPKCYEFKDGLAPKNIKKFREEEMDEMFLADCEGNEEFLQLLDLRLNNDFSSDYQMHLPQDKNEAWRTQLMDSAFDILKATCPHSLLSPQFMAIIREFYIFLAEKNVWATGKGWPAKFSMEVKSMVEETDECLMIIKNKGSPLPASWVSESGWNGTNSIRKDFAKMSGMDMVMESVWLISNHVAATCHITFEFTRNYWTDFYLMFRQMYLIPRLQHWYRPGKFLKYYPLLLGGFDREKQFKSLAYCVSSTFDLQPTLDPYARPAVDEA